MQTISPFLSFNLAVVLLLLGKILTLRSDFLRRYSIPEPVVGGLLCVLVVSVAYVWLDLAIRFDLGMRDFLLLAFFAGIGLASDVRTLLQGGRPLAILLVLATLFMVVQNLVGMALASGFGLESAAGLLVGSISLTGGVGTTIAWAPILREQFGIANAEELGLAANMIGLIAACVVGGPMATWLMRRHRVVPSGDDALAVGARNDNPPPLGYFSVLWAILLVNVAITIGLALDALVDRTGITMPTFVSCLVAGIAIRNLAPARLKQQLDARWPDLPQGMALISDLALGLFLTMALMGLEPWRLAGAIGFVAVALALQIVLSVLFTAFVVFRAIGSNYEAAVLCAGFGGVTLGSTATAIANMTSVAEQYGAAPRAFIVMPLLCGFFIDIVNALVISAIVRFA